MTGLQTCALPIWLVAPKGLPETVRAALVAAITKVTADPGWNAYLERSGLAPFFATGAEVDAYIVQDVAMTQSLLKTIGLLQ